MIQTQPSGLSTHHFGWMLSEGVRMEDSSIQRVRVLGTALSMRSPAWNRRASCSAPYVKSSIPLCAKTRRPARGHALTSIAFGRSEVGTNVIEIESNEWASEQLKGPSADG